MLSFCGVIVTIVQLKGTLTIEGVKIEGFSFSIIKSGFVGVNAKYCL